MGEAMNVLAFRFLLGDFRKVFQMIVVLPQTGAAPLTSGSENTNPAE